jgi:hypothetical protein
LVAFAGIGSLHRLRQATLRFFILLALEVVAIIDGTGVVREQYGSGTAVGMPGDNRRDEGPAVSTMYEIVGYRGDEVIQILDR